MFSLQNELKKLKKLKKFKKLKMKSSSLPSGLNLAKAASHQIQIPYWFKGTLIPYLFH